MYFFLQNINLGKSSNEEVKHFISMRVKFDDEVFVTDLNGTLAKIKITEIDKKTQTLKWKVLKTTQHNNLNKNILFQAQTDKAYLEKLMEIIPLAGVKTVYLFAPENSTKQGIKLDRLEKILTRSCEQSQQVFKPEVMVLDKNNFAEKVEEYKPDVLHCYSSLSSPVLGEVAQSADEVSGEVRKVTEGSCILVGPEGGWSQKEIEKFESLNLKFVSMGENIYPSWLAGYSYFHFNK